MAVEHKRIKNVEFSGDTLQFDFVGEAREANVLRRIFLSDIPVMAIESVEFRLNTTVTNDEFLDHRLQMIPVIVDADDYDEKESFVLKYAGKGGTVYSQDVQGDHKLMSDIMITKMNDNQELEFEAVVKRGTQKEHTRWAAATISTFKKNKDNSWRITVESIGVYTPERLLKKALVVYKDE